MFTGFSSENTPAVQVWDFSNTFASTSTPRFASLADDCAPIQYFKTGGLASIIYVYLPTAPIEGKTITICNARFGTDNVKLAVLSSDTSGNGTESGVCLIGVGQTRTLFFSKQFISYGNSAGLLRTGWITIESGPRASANFGSVNLGGNNNVANNIYSAVVGGLSNNVTNDYSAIFGGTGSTASGQYSVIVGGQSNTANTSYSSVLGGASNTASGFYSSCVGGNLNSASGQRSSVVGGETSSSTAIYSGVFVSNTSTASGTYSSIVGGSRGTSRSITGNMIFPASDSPIIASTGISQIGLLILGRETTNATTTTITSNGSAAGTTNQVILPNNSAYTFQGTVIANVTGGGTTAGWKFEGVIKRGANAASTTLVAAVTPTVIAQDAGAAAWVVAVTADTTNGGIKVDVTGAAATTIRWVCKIETTEVTY